MSNSLDLYRFRDYLTIHEVACLVDEMPPCSGLTSDKYHPFVELISEAVSRDLKIAHTFDEFGLLNSEDCDRYKIFFDDYGTAETATSCFPITPKTISVTRDTRVSVKDLLRWFEFKGFKPAYFFPDAPKETVHHKQNYQTRLMKIMDIAIARYYGDNFDPENRDTYPKQDHVIEWLMSEFSLTRRKAESIEIIITPRNDNYSKG